MNANQQVERNIVVKNARDDVYVLYSSVQHKWDIAIIVNFYLILMGLVKVVQIVKGKQFS